MSMHWKIHSKAFRRGFAQGFGAPMLFFRPLNTKHLPSGAGSLDSSWRKVEDALRESFSQELSSVEAARKKAGKPKQAA